MQRFDQTDARLLLALCDNPRSSGVDLAKALDLSRNTVQARLNRWDDASALNNFDRRVPTHPLNFQFTAFVTTRIDQGKLLAITGALTTIPEVMEVFSISGASDLLIRVVARDSEDLYRIVDFVLDIPGVKRTKTNLAMQELIPYRVRPLIEQVVRSGTDRLCGRQIMQTQR